MAQPPNGRNPLPPTGDDWQPPWWRRPTPLILGGGAVITLALIATVYLYESRQRYVFERFKPAPVVTVSAHPLKLKAAFDVEQYIVRTKGLMPDAELANHSFGTGGACVVADFAQLGLLPEKQCTANAECNQEWKRFHDGRVAAADPKYDSAAFGADGNGHCISGRCWYRPGFDACERRPDEPWPAGHNQTVAFDLAHVTRLVGQNTDLKWQTVTCANRANADPSGVPSCRRGAGIDQPPA